MDTAKWMRRLPGDTPLYKVVMPGSHDAGVYGNMDVAQVVTENKVTGQRLTDGREEPIVHTRWCKPEWAVCQHTNLKGQARCGSRFFDLRIYVKQRTFWGKKKLKAGHFTAFEGNSWKEPSFGGYGGSLIGLVQDAVEFVRTYPSEFLVLRFSHVKNHKLVREGIRAQLLAMDAFARENVYQGGDQNLGDAKVSDLKGRVVLVFDPEFNPVRDHAAASWMVPWSKLEQDVGKRGLHTCGVFKGDADIDKVLAVQNDALRSHGDHLDNNTSPCHLCCVYWQQTVGADDLEQITKSTEGRSAHSVLPDFVTSLLRRWANQHGGRNSQPPANVISHDFVTPDTCEKIIKMNPVYWGSQEEQAFVRKAKTVNL